jgi:hypothetical protein
VAPLLAQHTAKINIKTRTKLIFFQFLSLKKIAILEKLVPKEKHNNDRQPILVGPLDSVVSRGCS